MCLKQELLDALLKLSTDGPIDRNYGICLNVFTYWCRIQNKCPNTEGAWEAQDQLDSLLEETMWEWPQHSRNKAYPIADPSRKLSPSLFFWNSERKWDPKSPQGKLRLDLLAFCIAQLQIQLSKT